MKNYLSILLPVLALTGCATLAGTEGSDRDGISIEKVDSRLASIGNVTFTQTESTLRIRGEVLRKIAGRGPVYGHVHIDVLRADERTLISLKDDYQRRSTKVRSAKFSETLNINPVMAKKVRITHHAQRHPH